MLAIEDGVTTDVTGQATIAPAELTFTGNPTLAAKSVDVTASYNGLSATVTVKVPALQAGQFATLTPTIILQEEDAETKIVAVPTTSTDEKTKEKVWDNYELYWYSIPSFTYVEKSGAKVVEGSKKSTQTILLNVLLLNLSSIRLKIPIRNILNQQKMVNILFMLTQEQRLL